MTLVIDEIEHEND